MKDWKKWIGKDVIVVLKDGNEKSGVLQESVIQTNSNEVPQELRLLNGIFVTRIASKDISEIKESF